MQIQKNNYNQHFGMAIKYSPVAKKYFQTRISQYSLAQLKTLEKEQKNNPFDIEIIYLDSLRKNGYNSHDYGLRAIVDNLVFKQNSMESPIKFIMAAVDYANQLKTKRVKIEK